MTEMKRVNITIWDFLDRDIKDLNTQAINVSHVCRKALELEVLAKKLANTPPDIWEDIQTNCIDEMLEDDLVKAHREHGPIDKYING